MAIRICVAGATGKVGRTLVTTIMKEDDLELTGVVGRSHADQNLRDVLGDEYPDMIISGNVATAICRKADVLIDYTIPDVVKDNVLTSIDKGVHVVVGTSGLTDGDYEEIDEKASLLRVGVIAAGNFSLTATMMQHFAKIAAMHIPSWEIIDYASSTKQDAPSGTTRELAYQLKKVRKPRLDVPIEEIQGLASSRGATLNDSQIHSVRLPGYYSSSEITFGMSGERLSLRHDSISSTPYIEGTLLAVRKVSDVVGLVRGLENLLDLG
ncbi:MAG: 4-hydroxy-tetrahydrodipicolinate reductase [Desulfobacterales bacterium]|nr:4-hydroxy-tetrahydrodipicolinate reductase [Desulfobacterales bacterium]